MYCPRCAHPIPDTTYLCPICGALTPHYDHINPPQKRKSFDVTVLLALTLGAFGIHRYYTRNYLIATIELLTLGGLGILYSLDLLLLLTHLYRDGNNQTLDRA